MGTAAVFVDTWRALVEPRRLVPILLVSAPLVTAQGSFSHDPLAVPLGIAMCFVFVLVAPPSYRALFLEDGRDRVTGLLAYVSISVLIVGSLGLAVPFALGMGKTFLTSRISVGVSMALFMVGGWGLASDVDLEARLTRERARAEALAREAERAQLLALRANLDPHFLFNTLNAIAEWCRSAYIGARPPRDRTL